MKEAKRGGFCSLGGRREEEHPVYGLRKPWKLTSIMLLFAFLFPAYLSLESVALSPAKSDNRRQLYDEYYRIRRLQVQKNYEAAIAKSRKMIEKHADFFEIYPVFARLVNAADRIDSAIAYLEQLIKAEPENTAYYYGLGLCHRIWGNHSVATEIYKKAIERQAPSILIYYELVAPYQGDFSDLVHYFEERSKITPSNPFLHYGLAIVYEYKLKKYEIALSQYERGVEIAKKTGNRAQEGSLLNQLGTYYWNRGNYAKALELFLQAVEAIQGVGDLAEMARFLYNCGLSYCYLGNPRKGQEYYELALKNDQEVGNKEHEAQILRSLGQTHYQLDNYAKALNYYQAALAIAQEIGDKRGEGRYLADIASVFWAKGNYPQSMIYSEKGLKLARETQSRYDEATILHQIGNAHWATGNFAKALVFYHQAMEVNQQLGNKTNEASCLNGMGLIYGEIGDYDKALEYHERALKIFRETSGKAGEGMCLNNIALIHMALEDYPRALDSLERALQLARETASRVAEANRLGNIANLHTSQGDYVGAIPLYEEALKIAQAIGARDREAAVYRDRGKLFLKMEDYPRALNSFEKALTIAEQIGQDTTRWLAYSGMGKAYEKQGQYEEALTHYRKSTQVIEDIRARFPLEEERASYFKDKIRTYEDIINILFALHEKEPERGFDRESFVAAERAKARGFLDSLEIAKIDLGGSLSPKMREEEAKIARKISTCQVELAKPGLSEQKRLELSQELEAAEEAYRNLIRMIRLNHKEYAELVYPEPLSLEDIQKKGLDSETALLEYFLGEKSAFLFCVTKNDFSMHKLSRSDELQERVSNYIHLLSSKTDQDFEALPAGKRMYRELLLPVQEKLARVKNLVVVPDGSLNYLPFEALIKEDKPEGNGRSGEGHFLVADYRISYAPSASSLVNLLARKREPEAKKDWLAFADPVYALRGLPAQAGPVDERTREFYLSKEFDFSPLPYSKEEVKGVARFFSKNRREIFIQQDAREEKLKEVPLKNYRILHFATHGLLDERHSIRSAVVMTLDEDPREDGFFQVREIYNTPLNSDLVVLSACQTGRGKLESGEGVSGLSRAFLYAGAQAVVATLWKINDLSTSEFMKSFYQHLTASKSKDEALRLAKLEMMKSPYRHPYYWAAFVLIGDSRSVIKLAAK